jgi:DNA-directed RNA polymerase specialized sigma24 family protein
MLHYIEGNSVQETAAMLDIPAGTVYRRLFEARKKLVEALGRDGRA